jgi:hypothetical protein
MMPMRDMAGCCGARAAPRLTWVNTRGAASDIMKLRSAILLLPTGGSIDERRASGAFFLGAMMNEQLRGKMLEISTGTAT